MFTVVDGLSFFFAAACDFLLSILFSLFDSVKRPEEKSSTTWGAGKYSSGFFVRKFCPHHFLPNDTVFSYIFDFDLL